VYIYSGSHIRGHNNTARICLRSGCPWNARGMNVIGYVRVSTDEQGRTGYGLEAQRDAITVECERRGWQLLCVESDIASGGSTRKRPGLARALDACSGGKAEGLVAAKVDRLSRSVLDFAGLAERARRDGWNLCVLDLGVDTSTPMGEALSNMAMTFAHLERRLIGERTKAGLAVARKRGVKLGRPVTPLTHEALIHARRLRGAGLTFAAIADDLNAGPHRSALGKRWWPTTVSRALR
jgi:DNA invertase Pin-like site-specific DNA recombinase